MQLVILSNGRLIDVVVDAGRDACIGDLRRAAGISGMGLELHGRLLVDELLLRDAGIAQGDQLTDPAESHAEPSPEMADLLGVVTVAILTGRSAGRTVDLPRGRFVVGQAPTAGIRLDDATVSAVHAELSVAANGDTSVVDLGSVHGTRVQTALVESASAACSADDIIQVGSVLLRIQRPQRPAALDIDVGGGAEGLHAGRRVLDRAPRFRVPPPLPPIEPPPAPAPPGDPPALNIAALVMPLLAGAVLAIVLRNLLFVGFMVLSPLLVMGNWGQGRLRHRRSTHDHRVQVADWEAEVERLLVERRQREVARRRVASPDLAAVIDIAKMHPPPMWQRRRTDDDFGTATFGFTALDDRPLGEASDPALLRLLEHAEAEESPLVPFVATVDLGAPIGLSGTPDDVARAARSLVVDLAVHHGPSDLPVFIAVAGAGAAHRWAWSKWLPHLRIDESGVARRLAVSGIGDMAGEIRREVAAGRQPLLVVDGDGLLNGRHAELRSVLDELGGEIRMIAVAASTDRLPPSCRWLIDIDAGTSAAMVADQFSDRPPMKVFLPLLDADPAERLARSLDRWEDPAVSGDAIPDTVTLEGSISTAPPKPDGLAACLGVGADGPKTVDLVEDGPHALVAGMTGAGKSELLRTWIIALASNYDAEHLNLLLVDYKGGSAFDVCADLPHAVGVVTDLDDELAARVLTSMRAELRHREEVLRSVDASDLVHAPNAGLARLVMVVDEFAALADELPEFLGALVDIAQRGRSLGVHLILATQRPAGIVSDRIRANTAIRVCLGVASASDSIDIVGVPDAEAFGNSHPGRAILRVAGGPGTTVQTIHSSAPVAGDRSPTSVVLRPFSGRRPEIEQTPGSCQQATQLEVRAEDLIKRHARRNGRPPRRPWLDPLPQLVELADVEQRYGRTSDGAPAIAVVDDPERQAMFAIGWEPSSGNLLLTGPRGSGRSTALVSLVLACCRDRSPAELEIFIVDFGASEHEILAALPHVGDVVHAGADERLFRLLRLLEARIERRRGGADESATLLVVDGWSGWLNELDGPSTSVHFDQLAMIATEGPAFGVHLVAADHESATTTRLRQSFARRIMLGRGGAGSSGRVDGDRPMVPGRGVDDADGRALQIGHPGCIEDAVAVAVAVTDGYGGRQAGPTPIIVLPAVVESDAVDAETSRTSDGVLSIALGWSGEALAPVHLVLHPGEHALVAGPPRSGRTNTLGLIADHLNGAGLPDVEVVVVGRPGREASSADDEMRSSAGLADRLRSEEAPTEDLVVLVDDAERVEDETGILTEILAGVHPTVRLIVAGRTDALRRSAGRWTAGLRLCRSGVLLNADRDLDGDLLGVRLPRRDIEPSTVGRGHLIADGSVEVVQVARRSNPTGSRREASGLDDAEDAAA